MYEGVLAIPFRCVMSAKVLKILSLVFGVVPMAGELFLLAFTGSCSPAFPAAACLLVLLPGNLVALRFHRRLTVAQFIFCVLLTACVGAGVVVDGGIDSPLWFFQMLLVFGAGTVFGRSGSLVLGGHSLLLAIACYAFSFGSPLAPARFTSVFASTLVFTALSYLYEREKSALARTSEALRTANEELNQFAYRTSHDLRGPLISVRGLANFIVEDLEEGNTSEAKMNAGVIIERVSALEKLTVDILDLAKADMNTLDHEPLDLHDILREIRQRSVVETDGAGVDIEVHVEHSGSPVYSRTRITQILENLVSNSIRYRDPAERKPFVRVSSSDEQKEVLLVVEDNGLGIPEQFADRIFVMFERFHPSVSAGSGLGLHIVKKHVDHLGGTIKYVRTDEGSRFVVQLGRKQSPNAT